MITVIVPVYNTEPYLPQCLDSILAQTYTDLEILLIDDGSTDRCGEICDRYAARDPRIRVFHTENRGLSAARNIGLDNAQGDYIGFIDSDDWIEPDMYEVLMKKAEETGADVVECGMFREYPAQTVEQKRLDEVMSSNEAIQALLQKRITNTVWNKLWKSRCFESIRFPIGRVYEEVATTFRVLDAVDCVCTMDKSKYHYRQREGSLSKTHNMDNLVGCWLSHKERYEYLWDKVDDDGKYCLLRSCTRPIGRTWAYFCDCAQNERDSKEEIIHEMHIFTERHYALFGDTRWSLWLRIRMFFPHFDNSLSFRMAWMLNRIYLQVKTLAY